MEQFLDNKYVFWIVTAVVGGIFALAIYLIKKQNEAMMKRLDQAEADNRTNASKISDIVANLPIQYTLRDEFLRVTTDQGRKLDKITDAVSEVSQGIATLMQAIRGVNRCGDQ